MRLYARPVLQLFSPKPLGVARSLLRADTCFHARAMSTKDSRSRPTVSEPADVTPLQKTLLSSIQAKGPISVSEYMTMCLSHPTEGYYMKGDPIGARGDFTTSPEISQMFGELVGIWMVSQWLEHGKGRAIRVIELGPGRGTLMDDMLRTFYSIGQTRDRIQSVHLVETSARLREEQRAKLFKRAAGDVLCWHGHLDEITPSADAFTVLIAHEFFDALPIHIIEKTDQGFQEILVDSNTVAHTASTTSSTAQALPFRYVLSGRISPIAHTIGQSSSRFARLPTGTRIEVSTASWSVAHDVGKLIGGSGRGAGLIIDYGDDRAFGSSFRGFQRHKIVDVFHQPGMSDLTANVDFAYLKEAIMGTGATCYGPITQQAFLTKMGAAVRLKKLLDAIDDEERRTALRKGAQRLMDPTGMGTQYKVLGVSSASGPAYPFDI